jgi:hypothetical protein
LRDVFSHASSLYLPNYAGVNLAATRGMPALTKGFSRLYKDTPLVGSIKQRPSQIILRMATARSSDMC